MKMLASLLVMCLTATTCLGLSAEDATIYLDFEGDITPAPTAAAWQNKGTANTGEYPQTVGAVGGAAFPTITANGLKGQAFDGSPWDPNATNNCYGWGLPGTSAETGMEYATRNIWSFTVCGWIKGGQTNARIVQCAPFEVNYTADNRIEIRCHKYGSWVKSAEAGNYPPDEWRFFAVTYDGNVPFDFDTAEVDNITFYYGSADIPVTVDSMGKSITSPIDQGWLTRDGTGSTLFVGSHQAEYNRIFPGQIDELRIWSAGPGPASTGADPGGPTESWVLTQAELEAVRVLDAPVSDCTSVQAKGYNLAGDTNGDCQVDETDLQNQAGNWLGCNNPESPTCTATW